MNQNAYTILRVGLAITFLWIGLLILKNPEAWGGYISPWASALLPVPIIQVMIGTALFDIVIGFLLLIDFAMPIASFLAAFHLVVVLLVSGINAVTVRDVGLFSGALALFMQSQKPRLQKRKAK